MTKLNLFEQKKGGFVKIKRFKITINYIDNEWILTVSFLWFHATVNISDLFKIGE